MKGFLWSLLVTLVAYYWLVKYCWFDSHGGTTPSWHAIILACFAVYELTFYVVHVWTRRNSPELGLWTAVGSKVVKMLLAIAAVVLVGVLTDIPLKVFAVDLLGAYMATLIFEIIYFLKEKRTP